MRALLEAAPLKLIVWNEGAAALDAIAAAAGELPPVPALPGLSLELLMPTSPRAWQTRRRTWPNTGSRSCRPSHDDATDDRSQRRRTERAHRSYVKKTDRHRRARPDQGASMIIHKREIDGATQGASERTNAELVRRYFDVVWNHGDLAAIDEFIGDEFTNFGHRGADARALIRAVVAAWRAAFPDLHFEIEEEIASEDAVVHLITCTGTHTGTFEHPAVGVLEPSGRAFAVDHMHIHRVRGGRIVQHWGTRNDLAMLQQLGAVAAPQLSGPVAPSAGWQRSSGT